MAAPAETRTPNMHRAKRFAPRECGWKHGVSGHSAGEKTFVQPSQTRIDLTPTGLLMEGHFTQNASQAASSAKNLAKERIAFSLSSRRPRSSSSPSRFSYKSLPNTSVSREPRVVVFAVNLFTALGQVMFQLPQIRRLLDLTGHLLCFLNYLVQLSPQGSVEGFAREGLF